MTEYEELLGVEYARECFELRGTEVYWRDRPVTHFASEHAWRVFRTKYAGKPAGRKEHSGYIAIHMRHKGARIQIQAHRVIWSCITASGRSASLTTSTASATTTA